MGVAYLSGGPGIGRLTGDRCLIPWTWMDSEFGGGAPGLWAVSDMSLPCMCGSSLGLGKAATPSPLHSQRQLLLLWSGVCSLGH